MAMGLRGVPFELQHELWPMHDGNGNKNLPKPNNILPGQPNIVLSDTAAVMTFLRQELTTDRLDEMYWMLFLVSNRRNISPLHHQAVKGREIVITERPDLHLVWYYDRIFIKPIPLCLLDYTFYQSFLTGPDSDLQLHHMACGFLRTYTSLIIHESDFEIAKKARLLPVDVSWERWCHFMKHLAHRRDANVSRRYHYGELRLSRLNFYSRVFLIRWSYLEVYHQYMEYFARFIGPYLFIFGAVTVVLSAMQTALAANSDSVYKDAAYGVCTFSIALTVTGLAFFPTLYLFFQFREILSFLVHHRKAS